MYPLLKLEVFLKKSFRSTIEYLNVNTDDVYHLCIYFAKLTKYYGFT